MNILDIFNNIRFQIGETTISILAILQIIIYLIVIFLLTNYLNKFLKKRLLSKLGIDQGTREAITNLISYSLGTLFFIVLLQSTGFNLSALAVIGGGLGIGIGLGLQDLTKDFINGLILVVEKNIKTGDFIEFNGLEGYVEQISTRSTIIRQRNNSYIVVPNSELVQNSLINWSFKKDFIRISVDIGVTYGSDINLVTETLLNSADMEKDILKEPRPKVLFKQFGDHSLIFQLLVCISNIDKKILILSSLRYAVEYNLRQQKIQIAFSQTDLWIKNPEVFTSTIINQENEEPILPKIYLKDLLHQVSPFSNFNELELRKLIEIGYKKRLKASEILFREGDIGDAFYIILSGSVRVFEEKLNQTLNNLKQGDFFGEVSLILGIPRTASIETIEDTVLFSISQKDFKKFLEQHQELSEIIIQNMAKSKEEMANRKEELLKKGLLTEAEKKEPNIVDWMRQRMKQIFS